MKRRQTFAIVLVCMVTVCDVTFGSAAFSTVLTDAGNYSGCMSHAAEEFSLSQYADLKDPSRAPWTLRQE